MAVATVAYSVASMVDNLAGLMVAYSVVSKAACLVAAMAASTAGMKVVRLVGHLVVWRDMLMVVHLGVLWAAAWDCTMAARLAGP